MKGKRKEIYSHEYTKPYFLSRELEGYEEFKKGELSLIKTKIFNMLDIKKGTSVLDVGFGRGELLLHCSKAGAQVTGIDYSKDAYKIARNVLIGHDCDLITADARKLPFKSNSFDKIISNDTIEHMNREDGIKMLKEMYRVLKPGGFMIVHTSPNSIFMNRIYPVIKHIIRFTNPHVFGMLENQRKSTKQNQFHVYEYNLFSLKSAVKEAGLNADVYIDKDVLRSCKSKYTKSLADSRVIKMTSFFNKYYLFRFFLGNDLYVKCRKDEL
ncbi:MAG: class I SAM-dependent methyltransferase [Nanoarchaeota archaeon]